jgi:hypothetical protein
VICYSLSAHGFAVRRAGREEPMQKEEGKINCEIFKKQEPVIKDITDKINKAKEIREKAKFAEELQKEVNVLLSCSDHDPKRVDCMNCHTIAKIRVKSANLIIKAKKLA